MKTTDQESQYSPKRRPLDLSAVIGTTASLIAFVVMGWVIQNIMWRDVETQDDSKVGAEAPVEKPAPRKAASHARLTA